MVDYGDFLGAGAGPSLDSVELYGSALRVYFDEPMTNDANFQLTSSYTITPLGGGDAVTVVGVTPGPGTNPIRVDLYLSNPMTGGSSYRLTASASLEDAAGNPMDAGGLTLDFLGMGQSVYSLGNLGLIEAFTGIFGEEMGEVSGFRMTRTTAVVPAEDTTIPVESTLDWDESGTIGLDGIPYTYTGKTLTSFTGISHVAGGSAVAGAATDHRINSTVVDLNRDWSAFDLLRKAFLVDYAEGGDLSVIGRNLGVNRPPLFSDDDQFRAVIKAVAYNPKATVFGLELALEALVGAGNYEVYEDLIQYPNTVFLRVDIGSLLDEDSFGKAYQNDTTWDALYGSQDSLQFDSEALCVTNCRLKDLDELFDFRNDIPSDVELEPWPGETAINPFTYQGSESEGTAVTQVAGKYTEFSSSTGTVYYRMTDINGARITRYSNESVSILMNIPTAATVGAANRDQCCLFLEDGYKVVKWGVLYYDANNYTVGLFNTSGWMGSTIELEKNYFQEITVKKIGNTKIQLWVNGVMITEEDYSSCDGAPNHRMEFGIKSTAAGLDVYFKQLGATFKTITDYFNYVGSAGSVNTANPTRFTDGVSELNTNDQWKGIRIINSVVTNPQGGNNNGHYYIDSIVSTGVVELKCRPKTGATLSDTIRITVDDPDAFVYPDDLGKEIIISGSTLGNDGTYVIGTLLEAGTLEDYSNYLTPGLTGVTNICEVTSASFTPEAGLGYQMQPVFITEASLDWDLSFASIAVYVTGLTMITLRQALWTNDLVMEIDFSNVFTGQILKDNDVDNLLETEGPPPTFDYYPLYLADPMGLIEAYMDDLTAAGVIPEYETM